MPPSQIRVVITADPPGRLDKALARDIPAEAHLSRSRLSRLIAEGRVRLNGAAVLEGKAIPAAGEVYEIDVPEPAKTDIRAEDIPIDIVFEDDELLVVDKPAGLVVHPAPGSRAGTLVNALLHRLGDRLSAVGGVARPGVVHRIDKDTSGLLVVAKTDRAHQALSAQFAAHSVERSYVAVCHGAPDVGDPRIRGLKGVSALADEIRIATGLARHRTERQRQAVRPEGKPAVTFVRVVETFPAAARLECRLETGRTHQIRVHLAYLGHALIGDPVYGGRRTMPASAPGAAAANGFPRQALHAATLGFMHPFGRQMRFVSPLPRDMSDLLATLRASPGRTIE